MRLIVEEAQAIEIPAKQMRRGDRYVMPCGCSFAIRKDLPPVLNQHYAIRYEPGDVPLDCPHVWSLLASGRTKGIFQLESNLGRKWVRRLKPENIEQLSALVSLLRPGCLRALDDRGVSMTENFARRKNNEEPEEYEVEALRPILDKTYGILCIHEDTLVGMADGTEKPIREVKAGDRVNSLNGDRVVNKDCHGCGPTRRGDGVRVTLDNYYSVILTEDHEVYTLDGLKKAGDLIPGGDAVAVPVRFPHRASEKGLAPWLGEDEDVAYLLGYIAGNGCKGCSITIATGFEDRADILIEWINKSFPLLKTHKYFNVRCWYVTLSSDELANEKGYGNRKKKFSLFIERMGLTKTSKQKRILEVIFRCQESVRRSFLAGLFDSDGGGSVSDNGYQYCNFCSSSPGMIQDVRRIASLDGIFTAIRGTGKHLSFVNSARFMETIGKYLKLRKLHGSLSSGDYYGVVDKKFARDAWEASGMSQRAFCDQAGVTRGVLKDDGRRHVSWGTAHKLGYPKEDVRHILVRSVEKVKDEQFYGMSVADTHNLVANGMVVRNCYQEQLLSIAKEIGGFDLVEADTLRKACGKKDTVLMSKVGQLFIQKATSKGVVSKEEAEKLFENMKKSGSYLFNKAHAVSYSYNAYHTAYAKVHFPLYFFTSWLFWAKEKQDPLKEIRQLIADAKSFGIEVTTPRVVNLKPNFSIDPANLQIQFGLADVRGIGDKAVLKMRGAASSLPKPLIELTWYEFLTLYSNSCGAQSVRRMIEVGALRDFGDVRQKMLAEYDAWSRLTEREQSLILGIGEPIYKTEIIKGEDLDEEVVLEDEDGPVVIDPGYPSDNLADAIEGLLKRVVGHTKGTKKAPGKPKFAVSAQRRATVESILDLLKNPPSKLEDSPSWVTKVEEENLGIPISTSAVASADKRKANMTVEEYLGGKEPPRGELAVLVVEIQESFERVVQNGDNRGAKMGRLVVADDTGVLEDVVVFAKHWERIGHALARTGSVVALGGKRDWKDPKSQSFFVEDAWDA